MGDFPTWFVIAGMLAIVGGPTSAAWIGVKLGLNGVRKDIKDIRLDIKDVCLAQKDEVECRHRIQLKLMQIETKLGINWDGTNRRES